MGQQVICGEEVNFPTFWWLPATTLEGVRWNPRQYDMGPKGSLGKSPLEPTSNGTQRQVSMRCREEVYHGPGNAGWVKGIEGGACCSWLRYVESFVRLLTCLLKPHFSGNMIRPFVCHSIDDDYKFTKRNTFSWQKILHLSWVLWLGENPRGCFDWFLSSKGCERLLPYSKGRGLFVARLSVWAFHSSLLKKNITVSSLW